MDDYLYGHKRNRPALITLPIVDKCGCSLAHQHDHPFGGAVGQHLLSYQALINIFHTGRKRN